MSISAAVITCSDRAFQGTFADESGPIIKAALESEDFVVGDILVVPDDVETIRTSIKSLVQAGVSVIFTTGGTGVTERDVTVEATRDLLDFELPGIAEEVRRVGMQNTPMSMLSRALAGVVSADDHRAVVINAPGSKGGARDTVTTVLPVLDHLVALLQGDSAH